MTLSRIFTAAKLAAAVALGSMLAVGTTSSGVRLTSTGPETAGTFPSDGSFLGVSADSPSDAWAVGSWESAKKGYETLVERGAGRSWGRVPSPNSPSGYESSLASVDAHSPDDAWAVGSYALTTDDRLPLAEHWNGAKWSLVPISAPDDAKNARMTSVSFDATKQGLAVGYYQDGAAASADFPMADYWDSTQWSETCPVIPRQSQSTNFAAVAFAGGDSAWAVGDFTATSTDPLIEQWNGTGWTISAT